MITQSKKNNLIIFICTSLSYIGLSVNLTQVTGEGTVKKILFSMNQLNGFSITNVFLFIGLLLYYYTIIPRLISSKITQKKTEILLALVFAFFVVIGSSFEKTNTWDLALWFHNEQGFLSLPMFIGYFLLFFAGIAYIFSRLENDNTRIFSNHESCNKGIIISQFEKHPFGSIFVLLIILYLVVSSIFRTFEESLQT